MKAIEIQPGEKRVVHHANVLLDRQESSRSQEKHPGDGFPGMELRIESETFDPDSHLFFWKPGSVPHVEPDGMALRLEPGNDFVLNTHLQPSGKPESITPLLVCTSRMSQPHNFRYCWSCKTTWRSISQRTIQISHVNDEFTIPVDVDLMAIYPHAHYLGKELVATANLPKWHNENADPYSPMGSELAGGLLLRGTSLPAEGNRCRHALYV